MVLEDFLLPQEVIQYQSKHDIQYGAENYVLFITNRRIIGHRRKGFIFKKDRVFSVALEEVSNLKYDEQGIVRKKGFLIIETRTQKIPFEGNPKDVKVIWQEMQKFLGFQKGLGAATAYTKPRNSENEYHGEIPKEAEEVIKVLKMRLAKGEISEDDFYRLKKTVIE
ncbi:MAG: hypothetical protein K8Q89_09585 [Nitrosarchaeum sp.]|nr:hypothetical protein [Nitrosarchaeum sp.]